jgi:hypothetical protein
MTTIRQKIFEIIGFLMGWLSVTAQLVLIIQNREAGILETVIRFFSFFTILTNILVALFFTAKVLDSFGKRFTFFKKESTFIAVTTFILVVGLVYQFVLRDIWKPTGIQLIVNELLHSVIPVFFLLYWILFSSKEKVLLKEVAPWLMYPLVYLLIVLVRGLRSNYYPYPFLNISAIGISQVLINSVLVTVLFLMVMGILVLFNNKKPKIN